jgi:Fe-S-cluster containining protein
MTAPSERPAETVTAKVEMRVSGRRLQLQMVVPTAPTPPGDLLPLFRSLANTFVEAATAEAADEGQAVSCKKGCGACCRQLVPITVLEAPRIRDLVEALPEPRRAEIRARFAAARERLGEAGLLGRLREPERIPGEQLAALGLEYFGLGIPCPFLEDESCSIHPDRPLACREYLVTSPAENCSRPTPETVACVPMPAKVSRALRPLLAAAGPHAARWVPLVLAPEWAEAHPEEVPPRPGTELVRGLFEQLTGRQIAAPPSSLMQADLAAE